MQLTKKRTLVFSLGAVAVIIVALLIILPGGKKKKLSGAYHSLNLWGAQRAYPNRVVPDVGHALAFYERERMGKRGGIDDAINPWEVMGPANIGGRTLALALHPDDPEIIFAGSASGGLWKTTVGGVGADAWDYVETGHPVLGVSAIAINPVNPDVMYIGTGEVYRYQDSTGGEVIRTTRGSYGMGILKTTDGGVTWTNSLDWTYAQTRGVWSIRLHPTDPDIIFAGTTEGVYKSRDAGDTWDLVLDVIMVTDVRIHPSLPDTVFAACGNFGSAGHGIYRTTDGGDSWTQLTSGLPASWTGKTQLDIALSAPSIIYASIADSFNGRGLYRSTNSGDSWTIVNNSDYPSYQGWYSHYVTVCPTDPNRVFTGGIEIWRSLNGGATLTRRSEWTQIYFGTPPPGGPQGGPQYAHADHHFGMFHPTDPDIMFFASDGGVFRTLDGGDTFEGLNGHYLTTQFYNGMSSSATDPDLAMGGMQDNLSAIYEGTVAWRRVIGGDGNWSAINPLDDDTIYGTYQYLGLLRSRNRGVDWDEIYPPDHPSDYTAFVAPFVLCPSEPTILYAGRSRVYKSQNEGTSWITTNAGAALDGSNPVLSMAVSATSSDTVYAATAPIYSRARVFRTFDGGMWDDITGVLPDRYPMDMAVDPNDSRVVYVALSGFGSSHLFKSADGGDAWIDIGAGLPDIPTSAVEVDPDYPEVIYVGTDLGVYVSPDAGTTWEPFGSGMPVAMVNDLKVFAPGRKIRTATHGNAVFERDMYDPTITAVGELASAGNAAGISIRVHPNPVRPGSRILFSLSEATPARISVFDVTGRRVAVLLDETRGAGEHEISLDPERFAPGVFFARLETSRGVTVTRIVYVR